jgi:hypothetical protein
VADQATSSTTRVGAWSASSSRTRSTRRLLPPSGIVSPGRQLSTALLIEGGGHAVQPLQLEPKHPVLRLRDRTACRAYRLRSVARAGDELADFRGSTGARTRCSLWPVSRCQPLPDFPQPCDSRLEQRSANGPGRIRTCDLGIKSPATRAAASCPRLKSAENSLRRGCSKRSQIAPFGDKLVRAPVRAVRPRIA